MIKIDEVYCMDNVQGMEKLDSEIIDLSVTSPPYDNLRDYDGYNWNLDLVVYQLFRVTKIGGVVVWVVCDQTKNGSETGTSFKQALKFMDIGFNLHDTMIYAKENPIPQFKSKRYTNQFEYMFVFSKGKPKTFNGITIQSKSFGREDRNYKGQRFSNGVHNSKPIKKVQKEKLITNIWYFDSSNDIDRNSHVAQFPRSLVRNHIKTWSNIDDIVLDPFVGSGTTLEVAKELKRHYIGFDISQKYVDMAKQRIL